MHETRITERGNRSVLCPYNGYSTYRRRDNPKKRSQALVTCTNDRCRQIEVAVEIQTSGLNVVIVCADSQSASDLAFETAAELYRTWILEVLATGNDLKAIQHVGCSSTRRGDVRENLVYLIDRQDWERAERKVIQVNANRLELLIDCVKARRQAR